MALESSDALCDRLTIPIVTRWKIEACVILSRMEFLKRTRLLGALIGGVIGLVGPQIIAIIIFSSISGGSTFAASLAGAIIVGALPHPFGVDPLFINSFVGFILGWIFAIIRGYKSSGNTRLIFTMVMLFITAIISMYVVKLAVSL